jgi:hypothetical protein
MQPVVIQGYNLVAGNATSIVNANAAGTTGLTLATTGVPGVWQRRVTITSQGNDSGVYFHIVGSNQAGFTIQEFLAGANGSATPAQSNLDYLTIISITPSGSSTSQTLGTTAATVSAGVNGSGSSLWNILNWHVTPVNVSYATILQSGAATWSIQYTYDDPNNLPAGATYPQPFNHPVINNAASTVDGYSNEPITAWRLLVSAGTGTIRAIGTQAGIGGP